MYVKYLENNVEEKQHPECKQMEKYINNKIEITSIYFARFVHGI